MLEALESGRDCCILTVFGFGRTLLHEAVAKGNAKIVRSLIQGCADTSARTIDGMMPLHIAAKFGNDEVICVLIQSGMMRTRMWQWYCWIGRFW